MILHIYYQYIREDDLKFYLFAAVNAKAILPPLNGQGCYFFF